MRLGSLSVLLCVLIASGLCFTAAACAFAQMKESMAPRQPEKVQLETLLQEAHRGCAASGDHTGQ